MVIAESARLRRTPPRPRDSIPALRQVNSRLAGQGVHIQHRPPSAEGIQPDSQAVTCRQRYRGHAPPGQVSNAAITVRRREVAVRAGDWKVTAIQPRQTRRRHRHDPGGGRPQIRGQRVTPLRQRGDPRRQPVNRMPVGRQRRRAIIACHMPAGQALHERARLFNRQPQAGQRADLLDLAHRHQVIVPIPRSAAATAPPGPSPRSSGAPARSPRPAMPPRRLAQHEAKPAPQGPGQWPARTRRACAADARSRCRVTPSPERGAKGGRVPPYCLGRPAEGPVKRGH
jgi:hypothetical protein